MAYPLQPGCSPCGAEPAGAGASSVCGARPPDVCMAAPGCTPEAHHNRLAWIATCRPKRRILCVSGKSGNLKEPPPAFDCLLAALPACITGDLKMKKHSTPAFKPYSQMELYLLMNEVFALRDKARAIEARLEAQTHGQHNPHRERKEPARSRPTTAGTLRFDESAVRASPRRKRNDPRMSETRRGECHAPTSSEVRSEGESDSFE